MKTILLAAAVLMSVPAFASELVPVRAQVISIKAHSSSAHKKMVYLRVKLLQCGDEPCTGELNVVVPGENSHLRVKRTFEIFLGQSAVSRLEAFLPGGSMEGLALMAEIPSGKPDPDEFASR